MREIKFRAWDKQHNCMTTYPFVVSNEGTIFEEYVGGGQIKKHFVLMQYTGLKDKNGKEIYEGDILKEEYVVERVDGSMKDITNKTLGVVEFKIHEDDNYDGFYAHGWFLGDYSLTPKFLQSEYTNPYWVVKESYSTGFEIIGNIYANPELLDKN